jgi:ABC-2 type transport system ATP-binding protein
MKDAKIEVSNLSKSFGRKEVLHDVSFSVGGNEIFGLLGPNGAGKTTMIRIILDTLRQDSGEVRVFGKEFSETIKDRIGYLPEEGTLYRDDRLRDVITYFARLKGMKDPESRLGPLLKKFDLQEHADKRVKELSKGMQRKMMFIIAVIHEPEILILDEPFSGLDPINRKLVKDIIMEMKTKGMTIIMSTHQMDEVERMCDRILLINKGKELLYGSLDGIKKRYGYSVFIDYSGRLPRMPEVEKKDDYGNHAELILKKKASTQSVLKKLASKVEVKKFEVKTRSLSEIFIDVVENE